jgi:hypothetical protein
MHTIDAEIALMQIRTTQDDLSLYGRESSGSLRSQRITAWSRCGGMGGGPSVLV